MMFQDQSLKFKLLLLIYYSVCVDWCALSGSGKTVLPTDNEPWWKTWVSDDTLRGGLLFFILAIGSRALILYHPRCRFAIGLLISIWGITNSVDFFVGELSIASLDRFPGLWDKDDAKFDKKSKVSEVEDVGLSSFLEISLGTVLEEAIAAMVKKNGMIITLIWNSFKYT